MSEQHYPNHIDYQTACAYQQLLQMVEHVEQTLKPVKAALQMTDGTGQPLFDASCHVLTPAQQRDVWLHPVAPGRAPWSMEHCFMHHINNAGLWTYRSRRSTAEAQQRHVDKVVMPNLLDSAQAVHDVMTKSADVNDLANTLLPGRHERAAIIMLDHLLTVAELTRDDAPFVKPFRRHQHTLRQAVACEHVLLCAVVA